MSATKGELTKKDIYDCLVEYKVHERLLAEGETLALRLQRILESCYPGDPDKQFDLWCALVMDLGRDRDFLPLGDIMRAFKKWDVEEAFDCREMRELFQPPEVRLVKVYDDMGGNTNNTPSNIFNGISRETYYLNFNRDEIFKNLIAAEGHFRNFTSLKEDTAGFLGCVVKHAADAESHADEAVSHALIAEDAETSRKFMELRDDIRKLRKWIQSRPISREEGIREIRGLRRQFESFNTAYDVSKCETCGDPSEVIEEITKILGELKKTPLAAAAHDAGDFLRLEREMAEKLVGALSVKYGVKPPKIEILDTCHEPSRAGYADGKIFVCRSGVNLHVLAHEFRHHVQNERGLHLDEGDAERFAVGLFEPTQKGLYSNHNPSHSDGTMVKTIKDVAVVYGGQHIGQGIERALVWADAQRPGGIYGVSISLIGDIVGTIGGVAGSLYLKPPWDALAALIGGHLSTDLWRQAELAVAAAPILAVRAAPRGLVYAPPAVTAAPPAAPAVTAVSPAAPAVRVTPVPQGRYSVTR